METARLVAFGIGGAILGSFLNVVIHRVPLGQSIVRPGSMCPTCGTEIRPFDNVPILSYVILRGRCRSCAAPISLRYPFVEAVVASLAVTSAVMFDDLELAAFVALAIAALVALAFIDLDHRRLPNVIVLPSSALAIAWLAVVAAIDRDPRVLFEPLACGAVAFAILFVIALVSGGMGMGDVKLAFFTGLVTGRYGASVAAVGLLLGFFIGGIVAIVLVATKRKGRKDAIPFGPSIALGAIVATFFGETLVAWWLGG
jgi:leader peptidase (prepilin peptidase) / N-methyltransferase